MKWVLFCLMATTVPVLYFMFVVGGFLPLIAIAWMGVTDDFGGPRIFDAVHLVVYAPLFYWVAKIISRRLSSLSRRWKFVGFAGISVAIAALSFLPLYGLGHSEYQAVGLYRLFNSGLLR